MTKARESTEQSTVHPPPWYGTKAWALYSCPGTEESVI